MITTGIEKIQMVCGRQSAAGCQLILRSVIQRQMRRSMATRSFAEPCVRQITKMVQILFSLVMVCCIAIPVCAFQHSGNASAGKPMVLELYSWQDRGSWYFSIL